MKKRTFSEASEAATFRIPKASPRMGYSETAIMATHNLNCQNVYGFCVLAPGFFTKLWNMSVTVGKITYL